MAYAIQAGEEEEPPLASLPLTLAHLHSRESQYRAYITAYIECEGIRSSSVTNLLSLLFLSLESIDAR